MNDDGDVSHTVGSVETALSLVEQLQARGPSGVTELAEEVEMPKSTIHKHLRTLENAGYVRSDDGTYWLGLRFLEHGGKIRDDTRIYRYGRSKVEALAQEVDEMVVLSIREGDRGVFLFHSNDQYNLHDSIPLGKRFHLHQTAAGKAILAELDAETRSMLLDSLELVPSTPVTITEREELKEEIRAVEEDGFALNLGERDAEIQAVAAAVHDQIDERIGAISISAPTDSPTSDRLEDSYADDVKQVASKLSLQLKYN